MAKYRVTYRAPAAIPADEMKVVDLSAIRVEISGHFIRFFDSGNRFDSDPIAVFSAYSLIRVERRDG